MAEIVWLNVIGHIRVTFCRISEDTWRIFLELRENEEYVRAHVF